jgi:hypothetical protein
MNARAGDPFAALGLDPAAGLTDDDVRTAWRCVASATHPDRADGGDPGRFAFAAAAYTELRTSFGRGEARAALADRAPSPVVLPAAAPRPAATVARLLTFIAMAGGMLRHGCRVRLALRVVVAAAAATLGLLAAGGGPAGPALVTGALTWLVLTGRHDLGARAGTGTGSGQPGSAPAATGRLRSEDHADQDPT